MQSTILDLLSLVVAAVPHQICAQPEKRDTKNKRLPVPSAAAEIGVLPYLVIFPLNPRNVTRKLIVHC